jgi:4-hydroxy-tetrahydrodipicolinate reductase
MLRIAMNGAGGRLGRRIVALGHAEESITIAAGVDSANSPDIGRDCGLLAGIEELGIPLTPSLQTEVDAVIDFSVPAGALDILETCRSQKIPLVLATTGFDDEQKQLIEQAAESIPIVWAPSMSTAVNLTMKLVSIAAQALKDLPSGADVEIIERHHRFKEDAPSGTALRFGEIVAEQMGVDKGEISRDTSFVNDLNADSLDTVELVMEFEDEFEISIPDDQAEKIATVGQAITFINENQQADAAD